MVSSNPTLGEVSEHLEFFLSYRYEVSYYTGTFLPKPF